MTTQIRRITNWFKQYQPHLSKDEGMKLYLKLIDEELEETRDAIKNNDLIEFLDGCIDIYIVTMGYKYFGGTKETINPFEILFSYITYDGPGITQEGLVYELTKAIVDSNYTKELSTETTGNKIGKVIKGDNFIPPTEEIKRIIEKYNIKLITK